MTLGRIIAAWAGLAWCCSAGAQVTLGTPANTTSTTAVVAPYTVRGRVLNGVDGSGVPRALVTLVSRRVLTDSQGNFEFDGFTQAKGSMSATKPGFSATPDGSRMSATSPDFTVPVTLQLYPNAVVTGTVIGRDGLPVAGLQVRLVMASLDVTGPHYVQAGGTITDSRGGYRFSVAGGRYRVTTGFTPRSRETGEVVLPVSFPSVISSGNSSVFVVDCGQERRVDLQPRTGAGYPVAVRIQPENVRNVRLTVTTTSGDSFNVPAQGDEDGEFRLTLPTGVFLVKGHQDSQDWSAEGSTRVTVTSRAAAPVTMQLAPLTSLPVEISVDPAAAAAVSTSTNPAVVATPAVGQFNLRLHNEKNLGEGLDGDINLTYARAVAGALPQGSFRVPPGRYRLEGMAGGNWHVESATYGQTNLLGGEIVIGQGAGGTPIRLVVDNRTGMLNGTVSLPQNVAEAWVYVVSASPSLMAPVTPIVMNPGSGAAAFSLRLPIGSYNGMAFDHPLHVDLRDPEAVKNFSTAVKAVEITSGGSTAVALELAREKGGTE